MQNANSDESVIKRRNLFGWLFSLGGLASGLSIVSKARADERPGPLAIPTTPSKRSAKDVAAIIEITEVLHRYCFAVDRHDRALALSVWHEGGTVGIGDGKPPVSAEQFADRISKPLPSGSSTFHQVTNILIELKGGSASAESYVTAGIHMNRDGNISNSVIRARYFDNLSLRGGRWAIDQRDAVVDFVQKFPA